MIISDFKDDIKHEVYLFCMTLFILCQISGNPYNIPAVETYFKLH